MMIFSSVAAPSTVRVPFTSRARSSSRVRAIERRKPSDSNVTTQDESQNSTSFDDHDRYVVTCAYSERGFEQRLRSSRNIARTQSGCDLIGTQLAGQAIGTQEISIAQLNLVAPHIEYERVLTADRSHDGMIFLEQWVVSGQMSSHLGRPGVVSCELHQLPAAQAIGSTVAGP